MFYNVYRIQCTVDGAAYFGIKGTRDLAWGEDGVANFGRLGLQPPNTKRWREYVQKYGMRPWRLTIILTTTDVELAKTRFDQIMNETKKHPLSLNFDQEAHIAATLPLATEAARIANTDTPREPETKKKISKGMKRFRDKQRAENEAAGIPEQKLTEGPAGHRWIHNKTTNEEMMIFVDEDLLTGFEEGRLPKV